MIEVSDDGAQKIVDAWLLHLAAGKMPKTFPTSGIETVPEPQLITIDLTYHEASKVVVGQATWELNFKFTRYIEILSMAIESPSGPPTAIAGSVCINREAKAGNSLLFNTGLLTRQPAQITFQACLMLLGPGKFFVNQTTLNL